MLLCNRWGRLSRAVANVVTCRAHRRTSVFSAAWWLTHVLFITSHNSYNQAVTVWNQYCKWWWWEILWQNGSHDCSSKSSFFWSSCSCMVHQYRVTIIYIHCLPPPPTFVFLLFTQRYQIKTDLSPSSLLYCWNQFRWKMATFYFYNLYCFRFAFSCVSRWTWWPMWGPMLGRTASLQARHCLEQGWDRSSKIRQACQTVCLISSMWTRRRYLGW